MVAWLEAHDLRWGIGDYWAASITTVQSSGAVIVRPVAAGNGGALQQMTTLSSPSWYAGQEWQFLVYGKPFIDNVDLDAALEDLGTAGSDPRHRPVPRTRLESPGGPSQPRVHVGGVYPNECPAGPDMSRRGPRVPRRPC